MSDWNKLNSCRVRDGHFGSAPEDGRNGLFFMYIFGEHVRVICSDGMGWYHVSVSLVDKPAVVPNYKTMQEVRRLFFEDEDWAVQFSPPKTEHINNHDGCLHWWLPLGQKMPTPPSIMVGLKELNR